MEGIPGKKSISKELQQLFESDQSDRTTLLGNSNEKEGIRNMLENDAIRLARGREIYDEYKSGSLTLTNQELIQLGFLFHHSQELDDYWKAHELGNDAGEEGAWIAAAAEDRWLLKKGEKQKWGTQFLSNSEQAPMLSDEESGITDEMRRERGIPLKADQLAVHSGDIDPQEYFSKL